MRTTLDLDPDVLRAARALARTRGRSLGQIVSDLARRGLAPRPSSSREGIPVFKVSEDAPPLTTEQVAQALYDEP